MDTPSERDRFIARRRKRNIAIAFILGGLFVLFYVVTMVQFGNLLSNRGS